MNVEITPLSAGGAGWEAASGARPAQVGSTDISPRIEKSTTRRSRNIRPMTAGARRQALVVLDVRSDKQGAAAAVDQFAFRRQRAHA